MVFIDDCLYKHLPPSRNWPCHIVYQHIEAETKWTHFADDTFKRIFINENVRISIDISLKFVPKGLINNISALVQIMAWSRPGDKPLSEPMMVNLLTHICVTPPQWFKRMTSLFLRHSAFHGTYESISSFVSKNYQPCFQQTIYLHWQICQNLNISCKLYSTPLFHKQK